MNERKGISIADQREGKNMVLNISLQPVLALVAGILILAFPRLLNKVVAIYLLIVGITGLAR
jgi:hypothetical protein